MGIIDSIASNVTESVRNLFAQDAAPQGDQSSDPQQIAQDILDPNVEPQNYDEGRIGNQVTSESQVLDELKQAKLAEALATADPEQSAAIMTELLRQDPNALDTWLDPQVLQARSQDGLLSQQNIQDIGIGIAQAYNADPAIRERINATLDENYLQNPGDAASNGARTNALVDLFSAAAYHPDLRLMRESYAQHVLDTQVVGQGTDRESIHAAGVALSLLNAPNANPESGARVLDQYSPQELANIFTQAGASAELGTIAADRDIVADTLRNAATQGYPYDGQLSAQQRTAFADTLVRTLGEMQGDVINWPTTMAAAAELFRAHGPALIDLYTSSAAGIAPKTEPLAVLMSMTMFNPAAANVMVGNQTVPEVMRGVFADAADRFLTTAETAPAGSVEQSRAIEQFGQLTATLSGGAAHALTRYDEQIRQNEETRELFASLVGAAVGDIAGARAPVGNTTGVIATQVTDQVLDALMSDPERPSAALADTLYDSFYGRVDTLRTELGQPELLSAFTSAYSAELLNLQQNLNINLGGHAR